VIGAYAEMAAIHAPMLILATLLGSAAIVALIPNARLSWFVACLAALAASVAASFAGVRKLLDPTPLPEAQAGVALMFDGVGAFAAPLIAILTLLALLTAAPLLRPAADRAWAHAMALTLALAAGWIGALFARDLIGLVVATQIGWLAGVALVAIAGERGRGALNGALRMWSVGGAGAALMLLGAAFVARGQGAMEIAAAASAHIEARVMTAIGYVLMLLPLAVAAGLAPLQAWAGPALGRANAFVLMAVGVTGAIGAMAALTRITAYAATAPAVAENVAAALALLGAASVLIGAAQAIGAVNVHRLVAYAGATQAGCILLTIALGSLAGFGAALVQIFAWAVAAVALAIGAAAAQNAEAAALDGLSRRAPLASFAMTLGALSLMGAPLTIGFLGRWRLVEAGVGAGWWWATGAAVAASLAAVFYGGRLIERIYFRRVTEASEADRDPWRAARVPVAAAAIVAIGYAFAPQLLLQAASRAAALALGHGS
jgi:multicomponent Na+:H+ antiporter subunit D